MCQGAIICKLLAHRHHLTANTRREYVMLHCGKAKQRDIAEEHVSGEEKHKVFDVANYLERAGGISTIMNNVTAGIVKKQGFGRVIERSEERVRI
ncbi:hypothetical protein Trydic_g18953 [Trypoxylus dichotomus]